MTEKVPNRGGPSAAGKARDRVRVAERQREVARRNLDGWSQTEICAELKISPSMCSRDLKVMREEWGREHRAATHEHVERELASLQRDEKDVRERLEACEDPKVLPRWHEVLLKIRDRRAKFLGLDAPVKIEQKTDARVAFTDDVTKILADPDATTKLLDAVQGQTVTCSPPNAPPV